MITYAMASGVRRGWLPKDEFAPAVNRGWQAVKLRTAAMELCSMSARALEK